MPAPDAAHNIMAEMILSGNKTVREEKEQEMIQEVVLLVFLFILAWMDWKRQEISLLILGAAGGCGLLIRWAGDNLQWKAVAGGLLVGCVLLLGAAVTKECIGAGDGLLFCVTGIYLGFWQNFLLLFLASLCAAVCALVFLIRKKFGWQGRIPFAPFVLTADVLMMLLTG